MRSIRKLKSVVVHRFDCVCVKFGYKHGVMLNVTHRHVFISQQVNDPRRSRRRRRCEQPAMQQSVG